MLTNVVTSQVIRLVTERVIENLSRQAGRMLEPGDGGPAHSLTELAVAAQLNGRYDAVGERIDTLEARLQEMHRRLLVAERRLGWRYTLKMVFGVLTGVAVGAGSVLLAHLVGWLG